MLQNLLLRHHELRLPEPVAAELPADVLATLLTNLAHYGYGLTQEGLERLRHMPSDVLEPWWLEVHAALRDVTGDDREMEAHVVYKNFPAEVLAMDEAQYWGRQILMYWGLPNELFTREAAPRAPAPEIERAARILRPASEGSYARILDDLLGQPARWIEQQWSDVTLLAQVVGGSVDLGKVPFKENMVRLAVWSLEEGHPARVSTATDVLRLAVGLSDGDVSLREASPLRAFSRPERRHLLGLLEGARHLDEDVARRPERFKRLLHALRPGDYAARFGAVVAAYDRLYRGELAPTWTAHVEAALERKDPEALELLAERPGELLRRLHVCLLTFGEPAARTFTSVLPKLTVTQLLRIRRYLVTVNARKFRTIAPRGNWTRLQVLDDTPERKLASDHVGALDAAIGAELRSRLSKVAPSVDLDPRLRSVTLPTSDSELLPYGRGTAFRLPEEATFVRTASYWRSGKTASNVWYDNGWNFFDGQWKSKGTCAWNCVRLQDAAVFSGDPTNSKDAQGRACQLIDLYLDRLAAKGVRYGVWSLLCYSRVPFDTAEEVFGLLQWGHDADKGRLLEPARAQLAFPVRGANFTKFVAYLDVEARQVVFMDANLRAKVSSATSNETSLEAVMPAFVEYLGSLPTVHDLLEALPEGEDVVARYDDAGEDLSGRTAYVFRPSSERGDFAPFSLTSLLEA